jgi:hypothetical protein
LLQGVIWVFFRILMPLAYDTSTPSGKAHLLTGLVFSFNILFNYAMCVRTDPGSPPDLFDAAEDGGVSGELSVVAGAPAAPGVATAGGLHGGAGGARVSSTGGAAAGGASRPRWCRKCHNVKPPLTHHCSVCRHARSHTRAHAPAVRACSFPRIRAQLDSTPHLPPHHHPRTHAAAAC